MEHFPILFGQVLRDMTHSGVSDTSIKQVIGGPLCVKDSPTCFGPVFGNLTYSGVITILASRALYKISLGGHIPGDKRYLKKIHQLLLRKCLNS